MNVLQALADKGEEIVRADAALAEAGQPCQKLFPYPIRASIVVMGCATVEGVLLNLGNETKEIMHLALGPRDLCGPSSLQQAKNFSKKVARLGFPDQTETWCQLKAFFELRNALVHTSGQIGGDQKRRNALASLKGVRLSETGEVNLEAAAVKEALHVMQAFADELEAHLEKAHLGDRRLESER